MAVARSLWGYIVLRDQRLMRKMNRWRAPRWFRIWMIAATRLGDGWVWYGLGIMLFFFGGPQRYSAVCAAGTAAVAGIFVFKALKKLSHRLRPCQIEPHCWSKILPPDQFSFPSGHAMTAFSIALVLSYFYPALEGVLFFLALSIALSRIVLGMHFLSDVLAGIVLGVTLGCASITTVYASTECFESQEIIQHTKLIWKSRNGAGGGIVGPMSTATVVPPKQEALRPQVSGLQFLIQVSRPGLWSTTAMFYLMPLGHADFLHSGRLWLGLFFVLFPLGMLLYGVNDIVDAEGDLLNPRKGTFLFGSRGAREQLAALRWQIAVVQLPFLAAFYFLVGPRMLWWYAALLLAVGLYNAPRFGWKGRSPFDVLIQASYLLVFVLSSWLNGSPQLPWQAFVFGALFAMHSHVFGEVMDIEPDRLSGRSTTATLIGRVPAKLFIAGLLTIETILVYFNFRDWIIAGFLAMGALWFVLDATVFWKERPYSPKEMRLFLWGWNLAAVLGIFWNWSHGTLTHLHLFSGLQK